MDITRASQAWATPSQGLHTSVGAIVIMVRFHFTSMVVMKEMAVAVPVDSTIICVLLVPATMRLLGRWDWWMPGRALPLKQEETAGDRASS